MLDANGRRRAADAAAMFYHHLMASLALPGMSGFSRIGVCGFSNADACQPHVQADSGLLDGGWCHPNRFTWAAGDFWRRRVKELTAKHETLIECGTTERYLSLPVCWCQLLAVVCILRCSPRSTTLAGTLTERLRDSYADVGTPNSTSSNGVVPCRNWC